MLPYAPLPPPRHPTLSYAPVRRPYASPRLPTPFYASLRALRFPTLPYAPLRSPTHRDPVRPPIATPTWQQNILRIFLEYSWNILGIFLEYLFFENIFTI